MWWTDFEPKLGREKGGLRPPFHPEISCLERPSYVMCDQAKSVSRQRLVRLHPTGLDADEIETIKFALGQLVDTR